MPKQYKIKPAHIAAQRLYNQQINTAQFTKVKDLVSYMCAVQSQDYAMSKWAIGLRLPGSTDNQIEKALDKGDILRTHVLRPTWHIIAAQDIYWMISLSADKIKALMKTMDRQLELTEKIFTKSNNIIAKCVEDGLHVNRDSIAACLEKAKISTKENRLAHLLLRAELEQIICSGKMDGNQRTYASLHSRVPKKKILTRDESLAQLANRYFKSRGPATVEDFSWWSGLSITAAKQGLEMVKQALYNDKIEGSVYWFADDWKPRIKNKEAVYLLPAYDEFIIGYKNRTAALATEHHKKVLSNNGIFYPTIIVNGQVAGLWKRHFQKEGVSIEVIFFQSQSEAIRRRLAKLATIFGKFADRKVKLTVTK